MSWRYRYPLGGAIALVFLLLAGCVARSTPEVHYFSLLGIEQLEQAQPLARLPEIRLGIGPVTVSDSLRRTQIATRLRGNQYVFDEYNRWAGGLGEDLATVVGNNLGLLLGTSSVDFYPWMRHFLPTHRILLNIQRFDGDLAGEAVLEVRWSVVSPDGRQTLAEHRSSLRRPLTAPGYPELVRAESELVADLCRRIAEEVSRLAGGEGSRS